ncbi:MAG: DUF4352 domain-containing protein [Butyrivibrio sp.]|nr:DUF4352 domain-containing protein [Butyrivibrio sp.]
MSPNNPNQNMPNNISYTPAPNNAPYNNIPYTPQENIKKKEHACGIIGLIVAIIALFVTSIFFSIVAIILCVAAMKKKDYKSVCGKIGFGVGIFALLFSMLAPTYLGYVDKAREQQIRSTEVQTEVKTDDAAKEETKEDTPETKEKEIDEEDKGEQKDKYYVGDTWENKTIRVYYMDCYEFTDYNKYNAPADGNKIICAEFEFENIGNSDTSVMYTDFHGYADGYEVEQSYAPDGTGLDFTVKMSAGRKGTGKIAFEVPEDAQEIEIEFSPNFWTSENIIFVYD